MNDFLDALKGILGQVFMHGFGTAGFYVTLGITALVLYFASGWILKTIFSQQKGYILPFIAVLFIFVIAALFAAVCRTWVSPGISNDTTNTVIFCIFIGVGTAVGIAISNLILKLKIGTLVAFNITVVALAFAVTFCVSYAYKTIADATSSLEHKQQQNLTPIR